MNADQGAADRLGLLALGTLCVLVFLGAVLPGGGRRLVGALLIGGAVIFFLYVWLIRLDRR
jgi:hypothetical protein